MQNLNLNGDTSRELKRSSYKHPDPFLLHCNDSSPFVSPYTDSILDFFGSLAKAFLVVCSRYSFKIAPQDPEHNAEHQDSPQVKLVLYIVSYPCF